MNHRTGNDMMMLLTPADRYRVVHGFDKRSHTWKLRRYFVMIFRDKWSPLPRRVAEISLNLKRVGTRVERLGVCFGRKVEEGFGIWVERFWGHGENLVVSENGESDSCGVVDEEVRLKLNWVYI